MAKLTNCEYNCVKILYKLTALEWFIENHALDDADEENLPECTRAIEELKKDLEKYIPQFKKHFCKMGC